MFVFTKKGVLSPLQSISLLAIFFTSMGVATVSPAMAKLAAQFPSNNYALISTLPTLFIVPTTLWAGAVAGKKIRYRTISLVPLSAYPNPTLCGERYSFKPKDTPYLNR